MFARNEKYGHALHLQYGSTPGCAADAMGQNLHFGVTSFLRSMLARARSAEMTDTVEVSLEHNAAKMAKAHNQVFAGNATNENQAKQVNGNIAF
jgi:hypothetical protein